MRLLVPLLSLSVVACGGKIAPDPSSSTGGAPPTAAGTEQAPESTSPAPTIDDACARVCRRNGRCGAGYEPDCLTTCLGAASGACASESVAFTTCWAQTIHDGCEEPALECEPTDCRYARCAGIVEPTYCR